MSIGIVIDTAMVDGREPIRRTAYLERDEQRVLLVSAQGNAEEDRWVLGWEPGREIWSRIVRGALSVHDDTLGAESPIEGLALYGDKFEAVGRQGENSSSTLLDEFRAMLKDRDARPTLIVVNSMAFQVEVIFEPDSLRPAMITLLTRSQDAIKFSRFFAAFHSAKSMRNNERIVTALLDGICSNNNFGEPSWEQELKSSAAMLN